VHLPAEELTLAEEVEVQLGVALEGSVAIVAAAEQREVRVLGPSLVDPNALAVEGVLPLLELEKSHIWVLPRRAQQVVLEDAIEVWNPLLDHSRAVKAVGARRGSQQTHLRARSNDQISQGGVETKVARKDDYFLLAVREVVLKDFDKRPLILAVFQRGNLHLG